MIVAKLPETNVDVNFNVTDYTETTPLLTGSQQEKK